MPHTLPVSCALRSAFLPVPAMSAAASPHVSDEEADDITADGAQQLIDQFVDVTDSNDALAQMFLQKRKWKLLPAINDYFEQISNPPAAAAVPNRSLSPAQLVDLTTDSDGEADDEDSSPVCKKAKTEPTKAVTAGGSTAGSESQPVPTPSSRKELIFVTWNKDGISEKNLTIRTEGVIKIVKQIQVSYECFFNGNVSSVRIGPPQIWSLEKCLCD